MWITINLDDNKKFGDERMIFWDLIGDKGR
jgi:hypothetical protein